MHGDGSGHKVFRDLGMSTIYLWMDIGGPFLHGYRTDIIIHGLLFIIPQK